MKLMRGAVCYVGKGQCDTDVNLYKSDVDRTDLNYLREHKIANSSHKWNKSEMEQNINFVSF